MMKEKVKWLMKPRMTADRNPRMVCVFDNPRDDYEQAEKSMCEELYALGDMTIRRRYKCRDPQLNRTVYEYIGVYNTDDWE